MTMDFYHIGELVVREAQYFERLMSESPFQFIVSDILETKLQMRENNKHFESVLV